MSEPAASKRSTPNSLLARQTGLIEYLTSGGAIFGEGDLSLSCLGIMDRGLLHLEARFSHQKRMAKIRAVLARTLDYMGSTREAIVSDFATACPPTGIGRLHNARQFHKFLLSRWREEPPEPPYLPDLAAFEVAYAGTQTVPTDRALAASDSPPSTIRRHPAAVLLRTVYDIRPILEEKKTKAVPQLREVCFALTMPAHSNKPLVQALLPELFGMLDLLDDFTPREVFVEMPDADRIIEDLAASGLIEVRR